MPSSIELSGPELFFESETLAKPIRELKKKEKSLKRFVINWQFRDGIVFYFFVCFCFFFTLDMWLLQNKLKDVDKYTVII